MSPSLVDALECGRAGTGGRLKDHVGANPMYRRDVINVCRCISVGPCGYKLAAYMHASLDLGPRAMSWLCTHPSKLERRGQHWWVQIPASKQINNRNFEFAKLSDHTAPWVELFVASRNMASFHNPTNLFCFDTVEDIDIQLDRVGRRARYPKFMFSTGSLQKGFADTVVCNHLLSGMDLRQSLEECKAQGGWSVMSNVVRFYVSQLVNYCQHAATQPNPPASIDDLDLTILHPELLSIPNYLVNGNLPQAFQPARFRSNDGEPAVF